MEVKSYCIKNKDIGSGFCKTSITRYIRDSVVFKRDVERSEERLGSDHNKIVGIKMLEKLR